MKEPVGSEKGHLMMKKKKKQRLCVEIKQKKKKKLFSTSHQQVMSSHFWGSKASVCVAAAWEGKRLTNKVVVHCPLPRSSLPLGFIA